MPPAAQPQPSAAPGAPPPGFLPLLMPRTGAFAPGAPFIERAADQNAMRVNAISGSVPPEASSVDLVNGLDARRAALQAQQDAAAARARQGTLQNVGGTAADAPTQAGANLRGAIDQARAPILQEAEAAVAQGRQQAVGAVDSRGGVPAGNAATAQQS